MTQTNMFLAGVAATLLASACVAGYLKKHLKGLLMELCGTLERADFWLAFSDVLLMLVPVALALFYRPRQDLALVFQISNLMAVSLLGLGGTVLAMGVVVGSFIPKPQGAGAIIPSGVSKRP